MKVPEGYRLIVIGEALQAGDKVQWQHNLEDVRPSCYGTLIGSIGWSWKPNAVWNPIRPIVTQRFAWIPVSEAKGGVGGILSPTVILTDNPQVARNAMVRVWPGWIVSDGVVANSSGSRIATHFAHLPTEVISEPEIAVTESSGHSRKLKFNQDGSVDVQGVKISTEVFDEIVARRKKVSGK